MLDETKFQGKCFGYINETYFAVSNQILYNSIHFTLENFIIGLRIFGLYILA